MNIYTPYTYHIAWTSIDKHYYGVRYAKNCHPSDLWQTYFTSSKHVKSTREQYGEPDIIEIRKTFPYRSEEAKLWEEKFLKKIDARKNEKWLNKTNGDKLFYNKPGRKQTKEEIERRRKSNTGKKQTEETKRKIGEANSKKTRSLELRKRISESLKGRKIPQDVIFKREKTKDLLGRPKPNLGKSLSDETKAKISSSLKGRKRPPEVILKIKESHIRRSKESKNLK